MPGNLVNSDKSEISWSVMNRKCNCKHDISSKECIGTGTIQDKSPNVVGNIQELCQFLCILLPKMSCFQ